MPQIELDSPEVTHLVERDWRLAHLIRRMGPLEYREPESAFRSLAHTIIGQMLSMSAGRTIEGRLCDLCDGDLCPERVAALTVDQIRGCGVSMRKAQSLSYLAGYALQNDVEHLDGLDDQQIRDQLLTLPGVGKWTCDMFLLFHLGRPDILPVEDGAFRQAFAWLYGAPLTDDGVRQVVCSLWSPYSSTAVRYLYRALNDGLVKAGPACELWEV